MGECDADDFGWLSGGGEALAEGDEVWFVSATDAGDDEEKVADGGAASSDGAFALMLAAVLGQGSEAGELGGGLVGEGSDLWHLGQDAGDGAVGYALDGAEGEVEVAPERVGVEVLGDSFCEVGDLAFEQGEDLGLAIAVVAAAIGEFDDDRMEFGPCQNLRRASLEYPGDDRGRGSLVDARQETFHANPFWILLLDALSISLLNQDVMLQNYFLMIRDIRLISMLG